MSKLFTLVTFLLLCHGALAQSLVNQNGNIKTAKDQPLVGVSVRIEGTGEGTITDLNYDFSLQTNRHLPLTLILSMIGYQIQEVKVTLNKQERGKMLKATPNFRG